MKWSWRIGRLAGIDIHVHVTFFLLLVWVALTHWKESASLARSVDGVLFTLSLFGCVVLHELGHALAARRYGIKTRDITLLPIGGVARLERMPTEPRQEIWVALAGPLVNVAIAALLWLGLSSTGAWQPLDQISVAKGAFLERLMLANAFLVAFNLLPSFPMDGGRVLRALLALRMDHARATSIAATVGQGMALLFGLLGLWGPNPMLLLVALFVWLGAATEAGTAQFKAAVSGIPLSRVMLTDFQSLGPSDTLQKGVELILAGSQTDFPVVDQGHVVGILTRQDLLLALARAGTGGLVSSFMRSGAPTMSTDQTIEAAFEKLQESGLPALPVLEGPRIVGLLTLENLREFLLVQNALQKKAPPAR